MNYIFQTLSIADWFSDKIEGIGGAIQDGFRGICFTIDEIIYRAIVYLYDLFLTLCNGQIFQANIIQEISKRVGYILGTIMMFIVLISLLQMILNPDTANDKEKGTGNIIKKIIIVVVMIGIAPRVFDLTYDVQKIILGQNSKNKNVIQTLLLPYNIENSDKFGANLSLNLFDSFYYVDESANIEDREICQQYLNIMRNNVIEDADFSIGKYCVNGKYDANITGDSSNQEKEYVMHFDHLISILAGAFVVYILMIYCIKVGIRMIQLAFLQMISPMAFISYLQPKKDTMFDRWKNMYISTYLDVFIRVAIISLVVLMISMIFQKTYSLDGTEVTNTFWQSIEESSVGTVDLSKKWVTSFTTVIMIVALLQFGKRAPELLKEILPKGGSGSIGFGLGKKDNEGFFKALGFGRKTAGLATGIATGKAVGIIGGVANGKGIAGKIRGALAGNFTGGFRGAAAGLKSKSITGAIGDVRKRQTQANIAKAQRIAAGQSYGEYVGDTIKGVFGIESGYNKYDQQLSMSSNIKNTLENEDVIKHINEVRQSYIQQCASTGTTADASVLQQYDETKKEALRQMYAIAHNGKDTKGRINITMPDGSTLSENWDSNAGIYYQIERNEKRAGRKLNTYDSNNVNVTIQDSTGRYITSTISADANNNWKSDNNNIKNTIAEKTKVGK